jgi:hypothetical protein
LLQHYVLASLSRAGLFAEALFHGGTCLRIISPRPAVSGGPGPAGRSRRIRPGWANA